MSESVPTTDDHTSAPHNPAQQASNEAVHLLADGIVYLANDGEWFVRALSDFVLSMRPVTRNSLTVQHERFLIESGTFTTEELDATVKEVDRGALQLATVEAWLSHLCATMSLDNVTGFLGWDEEAVRAAVSEGRLYAVEISSRLRFPAWQFNVGSPEKLISGLTEIIEVVTARWDWQSVAGFMATPQSSLVAEGRQTPVEWLRDGGDVRAVREIVESDDWR